MHVPPDSAPAPAVPGEQPAFADLSLAEPVLQALRDIGYEVPSPIQAATIPVLLAGRDVIGQAQTGTGKTAAFALPILSQLNAGTGAVQALVLVPTRELAIQVAEAFHSYAAHLPGFRVLPIYGGQSYTPQLQGLRRGVQVVVATPGRAMDHIKRGTLDLSALRVLVLDEADEMLRMGFIDDVEWILEQTPEQRQIALFSATLPTQVRRIAQNHLRNPEHVTIRSKTTTASQIRQRYWMVSGVHKLDALTRILEAEAFEAMIVFTRTKLATEELSEKLAARGFAVEALNGDIQQAQRERTVARLRSGQIDIVVATDVAARGLDVERVSHVVNFDVPYDPESYVHRIGRTGRAGRSGEAILFIAPRERRLLRTIERATRQPITPMDLPSIEAVNQRRIERFNEKLTEAIASGVGAQFNGLIQRYQDAHDVPALDIAAALAGIAQGDAPLLLQTGRGRAWNDEGGREAPRQPVRREAPREVAAPVADEAAGLDVDSVMRDAQALVGQPVEASSQQAVADEPAEATVAQAAVPGDLPASAADQETTDNDGDAAIAAAASSAQAEGSRDTGDSDVAPRDRSVDEGVRSFEERPSRRERDDSAPRERGFEGSDRSFEGRPPRRERDSFAPREGGFDRGSRSFEERRPRREGDSFAPRERSFERGPRSFEDRPPREGGFDRGSRSFEERRPRHEGDSFAPRERAFEREPRSFEDRPPRGDRDNFSERPRPRRDNDLDMQTYRVEVGEMHGVKPGNIVGAIANEAGLEGRYIGRVQIREDHSFIDLPDGMPKEIFQQLRKTRVAGQQLQISLALKTQTRRLQQERGGFDRDGSRPERSGPRFDRGGSRPDQGGSRFERGPRPDHGGPRFDRGGPRSEQGGPRFDRGGPRPERSGSSQFDRGTPRFDRSGPRSDQGGPRFDRGGSRPDQGGARFDRGSRPDHGAPRFDRSGPRPERRGPGPDRGGPGKRPFGPRRPR